MKKKAGEEELPTAVMYSKMNEINLYGPKTANYKDTGSSACFAFHISSLSRALVSQVNLGCLCSPEILQHSLSTKALMWKIEEACNLQGCYPPTLPYPFCSPRIKKNIRKQTCV